MELRFSIRPCIDVRRFQGSGSPPIYSFLPDLRPKSGVLRPTCGLSPRLFGDSGLRTALLATGFLAHTLQRMWGSHCFGRDVLTKHAAHEASKSAFFSGSSDTKPGKKPLAPRLEFSFSFFFSNGLVKFCAMFPRCMLPSQKRFQQCAIRPPPGCRVPRTETHGVSRRGA